MSNALHALQGAIDEDAYDYLSQYAPAYAAAITSALRGGSTPAQIRQFVLAQVGPDRSGLAKRCEQAARWLVALEAKVGT